MSMSRKQTQKFSSVSNFAMAYADEGGSRRGDLTQHSKRQPLHHQDYGGSVERETSLSRKGPQVPKLNIGQLGGQESTAVARSSNRSNVYH